MKRITTSLSALIFLILSSPVLADGAMGFAMETANSGLYMAKLTMGITAVAIII